MKYNNITLSATGIIAGALMFAPIVSADMCTTQYGGTTTCQPSDLTVNKQVMKPEVSYTTKGGEKVTIKSEWVENLTTTDPTFTPGTEITYRLVIKNASGETFNPVNVKDTLPPYLTFVAGPGTYNADTRVLEFKLENVIAGETRNVNILAKVVAQDKFPAGKSLFCVVNVAEVRALNRFDSDSAQVCLQNGTLTVSKLPVAGFEDYMMLLPFAGVMLGGASLLLKKKS